MQILPISINNKVNFKMSSVEKKAAGILAATGLASIKGGLPIGAPIVLPQNTHPQITAAEFFAAHQALFDDEYFSGNPELAERINKINEKLFAVEEYANSFPDNNTINQLNVDFIERLTNTPLFYENKSIRANLKELLREINNSGNNFFNKSTSNRCSMANTLLDLYENSQQAQESENVKNNIGKILVGIAHNNPEALNIAQTWITNPHLFNDNDYTNGVIAVLQDLEPHGIFSKKYLSSEKFYKNPALQKEIHSIILNIQTESHANELCRIMENFLNNPKYYENPIVTSSFGEILRDYGNDCEKANRRLDFLATAEKRSTQDILDELDEKYKKTIRIKDKDERIQSLEEIKQYILDSMKLTDDEKLSSFLYDEYFRVENDIKDISFFY